MWYRYRGATSEAILKAHQRFSDADIKNALQGQHLYIDPATNTVVVKLSHFPPGEEDAENETRFSFVQFQMGRRSHIVKG